MPVIVEITNQSKLEKVKKLLGAETEKETVELALDLTIKNFEGKQNPSADDLSEDYFDDLFAEETNLSDDETVQAVINEREESLAETEEYFDINIHELNRIPPKTSFKIRASFKIGGRRKPMKYDFRDFVEDVSEE